MAEVTFDEQTIRYVSLFQDVTQTTVVDCIDTTERIIFVVKEGQIGRAIGKGGENIAKLERMFNRDVHVVEFSEKPEVFIANVFRNYDVKKVELEERRGLTHATVTVESTKKGKAIGRDGRNLRIARDLIARHHPVQSVSVA